MGEQSRCGRTVRRDTRKLLRHVGELREPTRDDDSSCVQLLARIQRDVKPAFGTVQTHDLALLEIGNQPALKPLAVFDEVIDRDRAVADIRPDPAAAAEIGERVATPWRGDVRGVRRRLEEHPDRHSCTPARHRIAEYAQRDVTLTQVRGDRQPVGAGSDHDDG